MWKIVLALVIAATVAVTGQPSPFDGTWVADVPLPSGERVRFVLELNTGRRSADRHTADWQHEAGRD